MVCFISEEIKYPRDVYKRQYVNLGQTLLLPKGFNLEGYKKIMDFPEVLTGFKNTVIYTFAVSYTHLDVYKRQILTSLHQIP